MREFHFHPDGVVYIRTPDAEYADTAANFLADARDVLHQEIEACPSNYAERIYQPANERHALIDAKGNHLENGPLPWAPGDSAIAAVRALAARQKQREDVTPLVPRFVQGETVI